MSKCIAVWFLVWLNVTYALSIATGAMTLSVLDMTRNRIGAMLMVELILTIILFGGSMFCFRPLLPVPIILLTIGTFSAVIGLVSLVALIIVMRYTEWAAYTAILSMVAGFILFIFGNVYYITLLRTEKLALEVHASISPYDDDDDDDSSINSTTITLEVRPAQNKANGIEATS